MNKHYLTSLFDKGVKTIGVKFSGLSKTYTYKTRETFQEGDCAIVDTPENGMQVVTVVRIDNEPELEANSSIDYKWIVGKVDLDGYIANRAKDEELFTKIRQAERDHHRESARAALLEKIPGLANLAVEDTPSTSGDAYLIGYNAYKSGNPRSSCPYLCNSAEGAQEVINWTRGWDDAQRATLTPDVR